MASQICRAAKYTTATDTPSPEPSYRPQVDSIFCLVSTSIHAFTGHLVDAILSSSINLFLDLFLLVGCIATFRNRSLSDADNIIRIISSDEKRCASREQQTKEIGMKRTNYTLFVVFVAFAVSSCAGWKSGDSTTSISGDKILNFDTAMTQLVNGLNELSNKKESFGFIPDEISVVFSLEKTTDNKFGIDFTAEGGTTSSSKIETFSIERNEATESLKKDQLDEIIEKVVNNKTDALDSQDNSSTGLNTTNKSSKNTASADTEKKSKSEDSTAQEKKHFDELKKNLAKELSSSLKGKLNANYSSVQTGKGSNLINIKFKHVATYPVEKIEMLAKNGLLGCLPFYMSNIDLPFEVRGDKLKIHEIHQGLLHSGIISTDACKNSMIRPEKGTGSPIKLPKP